MAHKTFCDRCGNEIKPRQLFRPNGKPYDVMMESVFQRFGYGRKRWELCYDCMKALRKFLNSPDEFDLIDEYDDEEDEEEER